MKIGVVGGGINGLCCAWELARQGHAVRLFERDRLMQATSRATSKLLHGGLRYIENGEFRLVREALHERDAWLRRAPELARPLRLVVPQYAGGRRGRLTIGLGLWIYDRLAGDSALPGHRHLHAPELLRRLPGLRSEGLQGGYEFSDAQMDDYRLGLWVAEQARQAGVRIGEGEEVIRCDEEGGAYTAAGEHRFDRVLNVAGPWAGALLQRSGLAAPVRLDLVRGSHLILERACEQALLLEVPGEKRIFFVLPWQGHTLVGTTEVRQRLDEAISPSVEEEHYLLRAYGHYFPAETPEIAGRFAGVRPLLGGAANPSDASREYVIHRSGRLITVFGGKWTTAMALARRVAAAVS